jgi:hypothetical protein
MPISKPLGPGSVKPVHLAQPVTRSATVATTAGKVIDVTGFPAWVRRITLMMAGVSTSGGSPLLVQIGASGGFENTGYAAGGCRIDGSIAAAVSAAGFVLTNQHAAADVVSGSVVLVNVGGNKWAASAVLGVASDGQCHLAAGVKTLSATLDRVRLTTVSGADDFDGGELSVLIEG